MSEDMPLTPTGEQPSASNKNGATQIQVQDGEVPTQPYNVDARWDEDKARTVGMAAREAAYESQAEGGEDVFDNSDIQERKRELELPDFDENNPLINEARRDLEKRRAEKYPYKGEVESAERYFERLKSGDARESLERYLENRILNREKAIDAHGRPFEELYDLAPEVFANMPTPEFIAATREFTEIQEKVTERSWGLRRIELGLGLLKERLEKRQRVHANETYQDMAYGNIVAYVDEVRNALAIYEIEDEEERNRIWKEVEEKYAAVMSGSFDKTPRQIVEGCIEVTEEYVKQIAEKLQAALRAKQEFLEKHGIKTEPEESETDTATPSPAESAS